MCYLRGREATPLRAALACAIALGGVQCNGAATGHTHSGEAPARDGGDRVSVRCPNPKAGCKYFKALCYEGYRDGQAPGQSEPTCDQVASDLRTLVPYTKGIRTYGSRSTWHDGKCIPPLTDQLKLDLYMGIWVDSTLTDAQNAAAIDDAMTTVAQGHPSIKAVIVGNEFLYRARQAGVDRDAAEARLVRFLAAARAKAPPHVAVVTAEPYADWVTASRALFDAVDFVVWNAHPWWAGVSISHAAAGVEASRDSVVATMRRYRIDKRQVLGETGWPWAIQNGEALGSEANQAQYFRDLSHLSTQIGLEVWAFEAFDQRWKNDEGPVGGKWGLWPADRRQPGRAVIAGLPLPPTSASLISATDMWP
jgi:exo-beta-1,3-glucanase (GH17 family)